GAAAHHEQVGRERAPLAAAADDHAADGAAPAGLDGHETAQVLDAVDAQPLVGVAHAGVHDGRDGHAGLGQVTGGLDAEVVDGEDNRLIAGDDPELVHEPARGRPEHHAGQV